MSDDKCLVRCFSCGFLYKRGETIKTDKGYLCSYCKLNSKLEYSIVNFYPTCSICGNKLGISNIQKPNPLADEIEYLTKLYCNKCNKNMVVE